LAAGFGPLSIRKSVAKCAHAASWERTCFEHHHVVPSTVQLVRGGETAKTSADHDNPLRRPSPREGCRWSDKAARATERERAEPARNRPKENPA
jgi:hypothetical protein